MTSTRPAKKRISGSCSTVVWSTVVLSISVVEPPPLGTVSVLLDVSVTVVEAPEPEIVVEVLVEVSVVAPEPPPPPPPPPPAGRVNFCANGFVSRSEASRLR